MDCTKLYVLRDHSGYAIELPLSGLNDPNFTKVIKTFEFLVEEVGNLNAYHINPWNHADSKEDLVHYFNKFYSYSSNKVSALFFTQHTEEMYQRMEAFVEIVNISFQKGIFLE